jgi:hypothetical protein
MPSKHFHLSSFNGHVFFVTNNKQSIMKSINRVITAIVLTFSCISLNVFSQNSNLNQNSNTVPQNNNSAAPGQNGRPDFNQNNPGNVNLQNNAVNSPYIIAPSDSVNHNPSGVIDANPPAPKHDALQEKEKILRQSGQNQVVIPPNPAGPDTSVRKIPPQNLNNTLPDSLKDK